MRMIFSIRSLLLTLGLLALSSVASAQIGIGLSIRIAPPELPVYEQPVCPEDGYIWTPGYWAYGDSDYYWVPGTWVMAPEVGYLWTPGYWGDDNGGYFFHEGYWGTQVGFYGGISYGYGYFGHGYEGGRWDNGHFFYNQSASRVNVSITRNVYNTRVENNYNTSRVSFNGGRGGVNVRATSQEEVASRERHIAPVAAQMQHVQSARANPELRDSANHGRPPVAATARPDSNRESGAASGREGETVRNAPAASSNNTNRPNTESTRPTAETNRPNNETTRPNVEAARPTPIVHARDIQPVERPAAPNTGNAKRDQQYQQQQQKLQTQQVRERQTLQNKQEQDHQRYQQKPANEPKQQQLEQKHQQQTQQLSQKHTQQQQQMQQRQQPPAHQNAPKPDKQKP